MIIPPPISLPGREVSWDLTDTWCEPGEAAVLSEVSEAGLFLQPEVYISSLGVKRAGYRTVSLAGVEIGFYQEGR
jgi:hypothetical protein